MQTSLYSISGAVYTPYSNYQFNLNLNYYGKSRIYKTGGGTPRQVEEK